MPGNLTLKNPAVRNLWITFCYALPMLAFGLAGDFFWKFALAFLLSVPGLIYIFKTRDLFKLEYLGQWKKSLIFEFSWIIPAFLVIFLFKTFISPVENLGFVGSGGMADKFSPLAFFFLYGLVSSPLQELIFRGLMILHLEQVFKNKLAITLINSLVFAVSHFWYPLFWMVPATLVLGLILSFDRLKHNSLVGPSVAHAVVGLTAFYFGLI